MFPENLVSITGRSGAILIGGVIVITGLIIASKLLPLSMRNSLATFSAKLFPSLLGANLTETLAANEPVANSAPSTSSQSTGPQPQVVLDQETQPTRGSYFTVRSSMLAHLHTLGISVHENEQILLQTLKSTYRKLALQTHPDKNSQDSTAFIAVDSAYKAILTLIEQDKGASITVEKRVANMQDECTLMAKENALFNKEIEKMKEERVRNWNHFHARSQEVSRTLDERDLIIHDLFVRIDRLNQLTPPTAAPAKAQDSLRPH